MHSTLANTATSSVDRQDDARDNHDAVIGVSTPHNQLKNRVSAIAASPNLLYIGTVAGDVRVIGRVNGEHIDRRWDWEQRCIEGLMFDFEGKLVYATEMNLVVLDRQFNNKLKEYRSHDPLPLSHMTGRRMRPSLDHTKVAWWGNRDSLSIVDLEKLTVSDYPMIVSKGQTKLVTYDILTVFQELIYILSENNQHKMIYSYDLRNHSILGVWMYENPLFNNHGITCRSLATNERHKIAAIGGSACLKGENKLRPFISVHSIDHGKFPILTTLTFDYLEDSINSLEFLFLAKRATLLATDSSKLMVLEYHSHDLRVLQVVKLHEADINCLAFHRSDVYTGGDDKAVAKTTLNKRYSSSQSY